MHAGNERRGKLWQKARRPSGQSATAIFAEPSAIGSSFQQLDEATAKTILAEAGLHVPTFHKLPIAEALSDKLDHIELVYPVAAKICSSDIGHKTEIGGVQSEHHINDLS